jgi:hypothetical protein
MAILCDKNIVRCNVMGLRLVLTQFLWYLCLIFKCFNLKFILFLQSQQIVVGRHGPRRPYQRQVRHNYRLELHLKIEDIFH